MNKITGVNQPIYTTVLSGTDGMDL